LKRKRCEVKDIPCHFCNECGREWCDLKDWKNMKVACASWYPKGCLLVEGEEVRGFDGELFWESKEREE
jgi:hypothetical protein